MLQAVRTVEPSLLLLLNSDYDRRRSSTDFNPANFHFDIPNTTNITQVTKLIPAYISIPTKFIGKTPSTVFVAFDGTAGGNMVNARDGNVYEVVCTVSLSGVSKNEDAVFYSNDLFIWDVDYHSPRDFSRVNVRLLDENLDQLTLQSNVNVTIVLKLFHRQVIR